MGIGHKIWQVEGMKRAWVWAMDNIKVDLRETGWRSVYLAQDRDRWRERWDILNFRVLYNAKMLLTGWETVSFSRRILLHEVLSLVIYWM